MSMAVHNQVYSRVCKLRHAVAACTFCVLVLAMRQTGWIFVGSDHHFSHSHPIRFIDDNDVRIERAYRSELLVLQWTTFFSVKHWLADEGTRVTATTVPGDSNSDVTRTCLFTWDRSRLADADYVMFHARDYAPNDMPETRYASNSWVFFCSESQLNAMTGMISHAPFNLSMTVRRDADFRNYYGKCTARDAPPPAPAMPHAGLLQAKHHVAAALISNCGTYSKREALIEELKQYIPVHVYGGCGDHKCPQGQADHLSSGHLDSCDEHISQNYKFILAFENSLCEDYVTEKAFRFVQDHLYVVPVVYGLANYASLLPSNSFIDVASFASVRLLADHLKALDSNQTAYEQYFTWRNKYRCIVDSMNIRDFCQRAHELRHSTNERCSSCDAWKSTDTCITPRNFDSYRQLLDKRGPISTT